MGRDITRCSEAELRELKAELDRQYAGYVAQNLKLDMSRGKPSGTQLNLTNGILDKLDNYVTSDGVDARNYGGLEGIPEARRLFSELLGIPQEKLKDIWERYYKVDKEHKRAQMGSGLGLSIVKNILDMHGGQYGVESMLGQGSTFWFELPVSGEESET